MSDYVCKSPVLVCGFNRPDLLKNCLEHVRAVNPPRLYISIDGPRPKVKSDAELVEQCRVIARSVTWCPDVKLKIEPVNLGCRQAMQSALDWFFDDQPEGIILEDDIEATPAFFSFCDTMLERYRDNPTVMSVGGYNPVPRTACSTEHYYLSKYPYLWGWASWQDRILETDDNFLTWQGKWAFKHSTLLQRSHGTGIDSYFADRFRLTRRGDLDTWENRINWAAWSRNQLSVLPGLALVRNTGFDDRATHTVKPINFASAPSSFRVSFKRSEEDLDWAHDKYHFGFGEGANYWPRLKSKIYYYLNIAPYGKSVIKAINRFRTS